MSAGSPIFRNQWGVVQKINGDRPELMPQLAFDRETAEGYRDWLLTRDEKIRAAAESEPPIGDPDFKSNEASFMWNHGFQNRPLRDATYHLYCRRVSDWQEIDE